MGGGLGHVMAQWLIEEYPPIDLTEVGVDRTHEFQATRLFRKERTVERLGFLLNDLLVAERACRSRAATSDAARSTSSTSPTAPTWWRPTAGSTRSSSPVLAQTPTVEWGFARGEAFERTARGAPERPRERRRAST